MLLVVVVVVVVILAGWRWAHGKRRQRCGRVVEGGSWVFVEGEVVVPVFWAGRRGPHGKRRQRGGSTGFAICSARISGGALEVERVLKALGTRPRHASTGRRASGPWSVEQFCRIAWRYQQGGLDLASSTEKPRA
jgi:hypothetical protein